MCFEEIFDCFTFKIITNIFAIYSLIILIYFIFISFC